MKPHSLNVALLALGTVLFVLCQWQLDLWVSPYVWANPHVLEVLPFWFMLNTEAYVLAFAVLNVAYWLALLSLWFWED